jgi:hypothetical protein
VTVNSRWNRVTCLAVLLLPWLLAVGIQAGCGKKGPPLAPLIRTPQRVKDLSARRLGEVVRVGFTVPDSNADGTQPADLERVEVYAYTAMNEADVDDLKRATRVGSVPVQRPVTADQEERWKKAGVPPPPNPGEAQGAIGSVSETMTPDLLVPLEPMERGKRRRPVAVAPVGPVVTPPLTGPVPARSPSRFYVAYGVSRKGRKGPLSPRPGVSVLPPPAPPGRLSAAVSETAVTLTWTPPVTERLPIQEPASGDLLPATPKGVPTNVVYLYNVYPADRQAAPTAGPGARAASAAPAALVPLNPIVVEALTFEDRDVTFGVERCYVVRAVEPKGPSRLRPAAATVALTTTTPPLPAKGAPVVPTPGTPAVATKGAPVVPMPGTPPVATTGAPVVPAVTPVPAPVAPVIAPITTPSVPAGGASSVESDPSAPVCVTPVDVFPPPVPASLGAVASEGAVSLIWEGVVATDLAGYLVLRATSPEGPFTPLFDAPIRETTYRDGTAKPGVRYVYVVVSADTATPRNVSSPSNRVEETAR